MADQCFFKKNKSISLGEIAKLIDCVLKDKKLANMMMEDVAPLNVAKSLDVSFLDNVKYKNDFKTTSAGAVIVNERLFELAPNNVAVLISKNPHKSYALLAQYFYKNMNINGFVSEKANIDDSSVIGNNCKVYAGAFVGENVVIGENCILEPNCVVMDGVKIGNNSIIGANASISHSIIGNNVRIYPGARIGQDGFGFAIDPAGHVKVPQLGRVIINDNVEIGANTTIDRGAGPDTIIGEGVWMDNQVQIAHNVKMGRGCVMVAQSGISGSTELGDYVVVAGQVGIAGHLKIGTGTRIAAKSGIMRDLDAGSEVMGYPALPIKQFMRQIALLKKMVTKK